MSEEATSGEGDVLERVQALLRSRSGDLPDRSFPADARLTDLGVDSVDLAFILASFERTTGAEFDDEEAELDRYETLADLSRLIEAKLPR